MSITESSVKTKTEVQIESQNSAVCVYEGNLLYVKGLANHNITISSSYPDYTHFDYFYFENSFEGFAITVDGSIEDTIDEDGEREYLVSFTQTGLYTITVRDEDDNIEDEIDIDVKECPVLMEVPRKVIIGEYLWIKGATARGKYVDIAIDGEVIPMLNDIPLEEDRTFEVRIRTNTDYAPASLKILGPVKIKAYIDRASSENIQLNEVEDGSIQVTMVYPVFESELSNKAIGLGDTFSIKGLAPSGYVDILAIAPRGGSGIGLSGNTPLLNTKITGITHWREAVSAHELAFSKEIKINEHAEPGMYAIIVLSPGVDGKYNGINSTNILDIVDGRYGDLFTKTKSEIINITLKATVEGEGSDDWWWMDEIKVGPIVAPAPTETPMSIHEPVGQTPVPQPSPSPQTATAEEPEPLPIPPWLIVLIILVLLIVPAMIWRKRSVEIIIERTIYDPCKRDFIESALPRMKEWINRYDPSAYWFAISIQNNTDKAIEEWSVELETSSALKIKEAKIEGIEIEIPYGTDLGLFKISVPKEYGIVIPKGGAQRVYFKLRAEKPKTTYEINGVFKSAITGNVPIRPKEFKYLCDVGVSPEAVKAELKKSFSEKDVVRLAMSFKTVQELDRMCNQDAKTEEFLDKLLALKNYMEGFSDTFAKQVEEFSRFMVQEQLGYLDDEYKGKVRRFCMNLMDVWISEFLR